MTMNQLCRPRQDLRDLALDELQRKSAPVAEDMGRAAGR